jgi:polyisoprenoid-binding protein YceI
MSKNVTVIIALIVGIGLGAVGGTVGLLWATGNIAPSQSAADAAPTLSLNDATPTPGVVAALSTQISDLNTNVDNLSAQLDAISDDNDVIQTQVAQGLMMSMEQATLDALPTNTPQPTETPMPTATDAPLIPQRALYRITQDESEVRFRINEILLGNVTEVIGASKQVAGDFIVNFSDPAASQLGEIVINARTLKTDNEFRDQSLRGQILQTGDNEFIRFIPTELSALPTEPVSVGDTITFDVTGDLTIKGTTNAVTFNASVTIESEERMSGFASVTVLYADFGIDIEAPPSVSGVDDDVILEIDFVALVVEE